MEEEETREAIGIRLVPVTGGRGLDDEDEGARSGDVGGRTDDEEEEGGAKENALFIK